MDEISIIANIQKRHGANLQHWRADDTSYSVTFRLAGSMPSLAMKGIADQRRDIMQTAAYVKRTLSKQELDQLEELHFKELNILHIERGACFLKDERVAQIVADALRHFDGERYRLLAWSIMPNHVHVVVRPFSGYDVSDIMHSWKSFSANEANRILERRGAFWQKESYDYLIRSEDDLQRCVEYTWSNPDKAGLKNCKWRWKMNTSTELR